MDREREQLWLDLVRGMRNRASQLMNDPHDKDDRNGNWYARKIYGDKYVAIREAYQDEKFEDADE